MDVYVYGVDLVSFIFLSAFAKTQRPHLRLHVGTSVTTSGHISCFWKIQWKGPSTLHRFLTPCCYNLLDRKVICFFSSTRSILIRLMRRNVLFVVYNCPAQQKSQISRKLNTHGIWWSGNLLFLQILPQPLPNCNSTCKMRYRQRGYTVYRCDCLGTPYFDVCFIGLNLLSYTPTIINYLSH